MATPDWILIFLFQSAVEDAQANAEGNNVTNAQFMHGPAEQILPAVLKEMAHLKCVAVVYVSFHWWLIVFVNKTNPEIRRAVAYVRILQSFLSRCSLACLDPQTIKAIRKCETLKYAVPSVPNIVLA